MNPRNLSLALGLIAALAIPHPSPAQTPIAASAPTAVPSLVPYSGTATIKEGKAEQTTITFQIFKEETAGEPLWQETQSVVIDPTGHYKVQLGATTPNGLPSDLFATGEARWLEVQIAGQPAQARVLLASVPYALKAQDATTLGGLPASAYALAGSKSTTAFAVPEGATPDANATVTTPGGTTGYLPVFTGANTIADSILYASSTGVGVGDIPNSTAVFDVNGKSIWRGLLNVSRAGTATTATGYDSYPMLFQASSYNSSTKAATLPEFELQAEPKGNNTATPGGTFNLLYNANSGTPTETGLSFNGNGTINFAPTQTFPGTITGVTAGTDLTGTVTNGVATLNLNTAATNALYAQIAAVNTFAGTQVVYAGTANTTENGTTFSSGGDGVIAFGGNAESADYEYGGDGVDAFGGDVPDSGSPGNGGVFEAGTSDNNLPGAAYGIVALDGGLCCTGVAGQFEGDVNITGALTADVKNFRIDHPLDPANKYLLHASVESSEDMNIYSGNVTTDELGLATIQLPDWFESLNTDFRYQLTIVGRKAQAWISQEVQNGRFKISTDATNVKVSWQITAVRQDAYAKAHPMVVEQDKPANEKGFYLHPELYGQPSERQIEWGSHPKMMQRLKARREANRRVLNQRTTKQASTSAGIANDTLIAQTQSTGNPGTAVKP